MTRAVAVPEGKRSFSLMMTCFVCICVYVYLCLCVFVFMCREGGGVVFAMGTENLFTSREGVYVYTCASYESKHHIRRLAKRGIVTSKVREKRKKKTKPAYLFAQWDRDEDSEQRQSHGPRQQGACRRQGHRPAIRVRIRQQIKCRDDACAVQWLVFGLGVKFSKNC